MRLGWNLNSPLVADFTFLTVAAATAYVYGSKQHADKVSQGVVVGFKAK